MTYSIVAVDADSGELGVASQSCNFGVGAIVPWVLPGVGAVASQAVPSPAYGHQCLAALSEGLSATDALDAARALDAAESIRQVAVVDRHGATAVFTGSEALRHAGHYVGDGFVVVADLMIDPGVWPAMGAAYESASGVFGERLLAALDAGEAAGGDARGVMSAVMVIASGESAPAQGTGRVIDIRVDHHVDPLGELRRLYETASGFREIELANAAFRDPMSMLAHATSARSILPDSPHSQFTLGCALAANGRADEALETFDALVSKQPGWQLLLDHLTSRGMLDLPSGKDT